MAKKKVIKSEAEAKHLSRFQAAKSAIKNFAIKVKAVVIGHHSGGRGK